MGLSLVELKEGFSTLLKQADPDVLPKFVAWLDLKISEYKVNTCIILDPNYDNASVWLQFVCKDGEAVSPPGGDTSQNKATPGEAPADYRTLKDILQNELTDYHARRPRGRPTNAEIAINSQANSGFEHVNGTGKVTQYPYHQEGGFMIEDGGSAGDTIDKFDMLPTGTDAEAGAVDTLNSSEGSVFGEVSKGSTDDADDTNEYKGKAVTINGQKYYACKKCGKMFTHSSSLHRHIKLHKGIFSHICNTCGRKFARKEHYNNHKCHRRPNIPSRGVDNEDGGEGKMDSTEISMEEKEWDSSRMFSHPLHQSTPLKVRNSSSQNSAENSSDLMATQPVFPEFQMMSSQVKIEPEDPEGSMNGDEEMLNSDLHVKIPNNGASAAHDSLLLNSFNHSGVPTMSSLALNSSSSPSHLVVKDVMSLDASQFNREDEGYDVLSNRSLSNIRSIGRGGEVTPNDLILLDTGKYKVETEGQKDNSFIRVTKQGKYLNLKNELQLVDGQWCFVCPHCGKRFERSSNFSRHMKLHRGVYSYICPTCKRGFFRKEHFTKHICGRRAMSHTWDRNTKLGKLCSGGDMQTEDNETVSILAPTTSPKAASKAEIYPASFSKSPLHSIEMEVPTELDAVPASKMEPVGASRRKPRRCNVTRVDVNMDDQSDNSQQEFSVDNIQPEESIVIE